MMANNHSELSIFQEKAPSVQPTSVATTPAWVKGRQGKRLIVILRASGCAYDLRPGGGCRYCGFRRLTTNGSSVTESELVAQFKWAMQQYDFGKEPILELDIFNSGNFLNDLEIPPTARREIIRQTASLTGLSVVVIESRPEYIRAASLEDLHEVLGNGLQLEVGIGLDAYSDHLRQRILRKGVTRKAFESAVSRLAPTATGLLCYVMLKPWSMDDNRASADAVRCAEYAHEVAARFGLSCRIALEPTFVVPGTPLSQLYLEGSYNPPSLWLVKETLERIAKFGAVQVGMWDEGLQPLAVPSASPKYQPILREMFNNFNLTQDIGVLRERESCDCGQK